MPIVVEKVADPCVLGEGPHWDVRTQSLYYVDIWQNTIHKYTPSTKKHSKVVVGEKTVSIVIPVKGAPDKYLITFGREVATITWDGVSDKISDYKKIVEVDTKEESLGNRINDGKCDASGRLWCGTMGPEPEPLQIAPKMGSLYSVDPDGKSKFHVNSITCSNGLAWNVDNTKVYYIDSWTKEVHGFDFDIKNGEISNREVVFSLDEVGIDGYPDGQTIDTDGNLWVAVFNAFRVIKIDPRKRNTLLQTVDIPSKQITSVAFGGPNLDELYVTSGSITVDGEVLAPPNHGAVFRVTGLGVKGYPAADANF